MGRNALHRVILLFPNPMLSRALSAQLRSSASRRVRSMAMAHSSIPFLFHRTIGSLVIGHLAQNGLTKNTLSAIQLATAFGDVC